LGTAKIEGEDDVQKERHKFRNTKRGVRRQHVPEQHQHQPGNLYDCSTSDLRTIINVGRDTRNIIIARRRSAMRWRPTAPPTIISLSTTWVQLGNASQKSGNNPLEERKP
jgi:hypothetical protein